jgi:hypothetical protein
MVLVLKENSMIDEFNLNKQEAIIFIKFLQLEKKRHSEDITKIISTMVYLKCKFKIN